MNCKKCNTPITELDLYCPGCGEPVEASAVSVGAVGSVSDGFRGVISKNLHSTLFLVYAIFTTLVAVASLAVAFTTPGIGMVVGLIVTAFAAVSCAFAWKIWITKDVVKAKDIRLLAVYPVFMKIFSALECILCGIISFFILIVSVVGGLLMVGLSSIGDAVNEFIAELGLEAQLTEQLQGMLENGGWILAVVGVVTVVLIMFISINTVLLFSKAAKHYKRISLSYEEGIYDVKVGAPYKRLWIFGVLYAIGGLGVMLVSAVSALEIVAMAGTLITTALLFTSIHKDMKEYASNPIVELPIDEGTEVVAEPEEPVVEETAEREDASEEAVEEIEEQPTEETESVSQEQVDTDSVEAHEDDVNEEVCTTASEAE